MIRTMQHKSRVKGMAILLMPVLLYRALVPVGFMPAGNIGDGVRLGLCPGTVDIATFIAAASDPHAHHHHSGATGSSHAHHASPCPYALSSAAPFAIEPLMPVVAARVEEEPRPAATAAVFLPTILRSQSPRAPPSPV